MLFRVLPALHNLDNLQCDRDPGCLPRTHGIFSAQPVELFQLRSLTIGGSSFFVRFYFLCQFQPKELSTIYHGVPPKPHQFVASHASFTGCLVQLLRLAYQLTHHFVPFCGTKLYSPIVPLVLLHLRYARLSSLVIPSLPILMLSMT